MVIMEKDECTCCENKDDQISDLEIEISELKEEINNLQQRLIQIQSLSDY